MYPRHLLKTAFLVSGAIFLMISVSAYAADKKDRQQGRLVLGKVLDEHDNPVVNAIVYLTNTRNHTVKTYIIGQEGIYRFPGLSNVDYEVYAQYKDRRSDTKSVSQFDDRSQVYIDLKINSH